MIKKRCVIAIVVLIGVLVGSAGKKNVYAETEGSTESFEEIETELESEAESELDENDKSEIEENNKETISSASDEVKVTEHVAAEDVEEQIENAREQEIAVLSLQQQSVIRYCSHVQYEGWQKEVKEGETSGTVGFGRHVEAIKIVVQDGNVSGGVEYRSHVQYMGWEQSWSSQGQISGTTGLNRNIEAVQIRLTGDMSRKYDIYYRAHCQDYGWLDWAKNGEASGTEGFSKRLEAIQIVLVEKGATAPGPTERAYYGNLQIQYKMCLLGGNWQNYVSNGALSGTSGKSTLTEALAIKITGNGQTEESVEYRTHVQDYGWQNWTSEGVVNGKPGEKRRLEAVEIRLTGNMVNSYDVYYRAHIQDFGWTGWAKNGESCGSEGYAKRLEALEVRLVTKNGQAPGSVENTFYKPDSWGIDVSSYQGSINWVKAKADGVEFAMLRVTKKNTTGTAATLMEDPYFKRNAQGALANGIKIGAYVYIYASTPEEAKAEAEYAISLMKGFNITYPVAFDLEESKHMTTAAKLNNMAMANAFCSTMAAAGYKTMVYGSPSKLTTVFDYAKIAASYDIWLARYRWYPDVMYFSDESMRDMVYATGYEGGNWKNLSNVKIWQFSDSGRVSGISGNVDLDLCYKLY